LGWRILGEGDRPALLELLEGDPVHNVFLLGVLHEIGLRGHPGAWASRFYGIERHGRLAATMFAPGRLVVPYIGEEDLAASAADRLGSDAVSIHMIVGERRSVDALWHRWRAGRPVRARTFFDQHLYALEPGDVRGPDAPGLRPATADDLGPVVQASVAMSVEDIGYDPAERDPESYRRRILRLVAEGRIWIITEGDELRFKINVGPRSPQGVQIEGTYVPPRLRGKGLATAGVATASRRLLDELPRVALHVNEANQPAVRLYERVGFRRAVPYRLIVVDGD
jgi:ribosomal protein S18 acetylase RimI-like enzyme